MKLKMKKIKIYIILLGITLSSSLTSCFDNYLDIVPDNLATIENAFTMRVTAERFLFTCYSWLPSESSLQSSPALMTADELWTPLGGTYEVNFKGIAWNIARGNQGVVEPYINYWDGAKNGKPLFRAIRECNIFLENVGKVPDLDEYERNRWIGEVKSLKAYYHFLLLRMYGPVPIIDTNLPISASIEQVKVFREPIDKCFDFIIKTMDEAIEFLPDVIIDETTEKGRIDKCVAKSMKAQILVYAASPLFNGNTDYANFSDPRDNQPFFNQNFEETKWVKAAKACEEAVKICEENGFELNYFVPGGSQNLSQTTINQLSFRNALTERTNRELIWVNMKAGFGGGTTQQPYVLARGVIGESNTGSTTGGLGVPLKMVDKFYTENGVPIDEDKSWNYVNRYNLRVATDESSVNLINGYLSVELDFAREDRFYASLGFDGGRLFGQGRVKETDQYPIQMKAFQSAGVKRNDAYVVTGYFPKKLINYQTIIRGSTVTAENYYWPIMRLANLYLLYAEATNEAYGPNDTAISILDKVRLRSGLKGIKESWTNYSTNPTKFKTKEGFREILMQERTIELMFEGQRAWDLRRWKTAMQELNAPILGWNLLEKTEREYYTPINLFDQEFNLKDYFWPIKEYSLQVNRNLVQNPGW